MSDYKADLLADLKNPAYAEQYVKAALRESRKAFLIALKDVADARFGMSKLAEQVVMNRESLYRTLSEQGNPRMSTLQSLVDVLGFELTLKNKDNGTRRKRISRPRTESRQGSRAKSR
jgi:probable addiction module antidote protein